MSFCSLMILGLITLTIVFLFAGPLAALLWYACGTIILVLIGLLFGHKEDIYETKCGYSNTEVQNTICAEKTSCKFRIPNFAQDNYGDEIEADCHYSYRYLIEQRTIFIGILPFIIHKIQSVCTKKKNLLIS